MKKKFRNHGNHKTVIKRPILDNFWTFLHFLWLPNFAFFMVAMVTNFIFFNLFSLNIEWAWVADNFCVLHDILYALFDAWYHKGSQKCAKIVQNLSVLWLFYGCHGYEINFFHYFSVQPGRAWLAGHFGVLHDLLYVIIDVWGCEKH